MAWLELGVVGLGLFLLWATIIKYLCFSPADFATNKEGEKTLRTEKLIAIKQSIYSIVFMLVGVILILCCIEDYLEQSSRADAKIHGYLLQALTLPLLLNALLLIVGTLLVTHSHIVRIVSGSLNRKWGWSSNMSTGHLHKCKTWIFISFYIKCLNLVGIVGTIVYLLITSPTSATLPRKKSLAIILIILIISFCLAYVPIDRNVTFFEKMLNELALDGCLPRRRREMVNHSRSSRQTATAAAATTIFDETLQSSARIPPCQLLPPPEYSTIVINITPTAPPAAAAAGQVDVDEEEGLPPPSYSDALSMRRGLGLGLGFTAPPPTNENQNRYPSASAPPDSPTPSAPPPPPPPTYTEIQRSSSSSTSSSTNINNNNDAVLKL